jgi:hypothetical protein
MNIFHKTSTAAVNFSGKSLIFSALALSLVATSSTPASAQASSINLAGKNSVTFVASNLSNAAGFGVHFSTTRYTDGFGGTDAECHFVSGTVQTPNPAMILVCYDGYKDPQNAQNEFRLDLGPKKQYSKDVLSTVTFTVRRDGVKVKAVRIATNPYTNEQKPYTIEGFFPLRQETGFFKTGTIYYQTNGVLAGSTDRRGTGYVLATPVAQ